MRYGPTSGISAPSEIRVLPAVRTSLPMGVSGTGPRATSSASAALALSARLDARASDCAGSIVLAAARVVMLSVIRPEHAEHSPRTAGALGSIVAPQRRHIGRGACSACDLRGLSIGGHRAETAGVRPGL